MMMVMFTMTAAAMMLLLVMVVMMLTVATAAMMLLLVMVVMMFTVATAAMMLLLVMMVVMLTVATAAVVLFLVMMVVMLTVATAAAVVLLIVVVMMVMVLMLQFLHVRSQRIPTGHCLQNLCTGELGPGSGHQSSFAVVLADQCHSGIQLSLGNGIGTGQDDGRSSLDLVVVELTEVLHIHLDLAGIGNRHSMTQHHILGDHLFHRSHNIAELAHTGGLDDDAVGVIFLDHLLQGLAEIAYQAAANAAGIHFCNVDAGILQEAAVDADFTELIFDQHQLLALISLLDHLLDQRGLASAEETGINVNFGHNNTFCLFYR